MSLMWQSRPRLALARADAYIAADAPSSTTGRVLSAHLPASPSISRDCEEQLSVCA